MLVGGALHLKYFEDLIDFRVAYEQGFSLGHFSEDAANGPNVYRCWVLFSSKKNLRGSVPQRDNLMCVCLDRKAEGSCQTEIC